MCMQCCVHAFMRACTLRVRDRQRFRAGELQRLGHRDASRWNRSKRTRKWQEARRAQASITMARKSLTFVRVGPVTTRSPRAAKTE
jgi:hypothetical protein